MSLKVALAKGRLLEPALTLFERIGAAAAGAATTRKLVVPSSDGSLSFLLVKPADVPVYVESGAADLGITGTDVLRETEADVLEPLALGFGTCRLVVASPAHVPYPSLPGGAVRFWRRFGECGVCKFGWSEGKEHASTSTKAKAVSTAGVAPALPSRAPTSRRSGSALPS